MNTNVVEKHINKHGFYAVRDGLEIRKMSDMMLPFWIVWHGIPAMGFQTVAEALDEVIDA